MALKATVYKAEVQLSDLDHHVYQQLNLTLAKHPSETDERMMLRLLAFAFHADDDLIFGRGISTEDEPDLWRKNLTGEIELWVDLGTPEPTRLKKASGRAREVVLYAYGGRGVSIWWDKVGSEISRIANLRAFELAADDCAAAAALVKPSMDLQCTIDGGEAWLGNTETSLMIRPEPLGPV